MKFNKLIQRKMGQTESKMKDYENDQMEELKKKIDQEGPAAANTYIEESINSWKTVDVKLAVSGCTATGKSTFINTLRGVKRGDADYAEVGFGDTTLQVTAYPHPDNARIVYYDLPGFGTLEVKKEKYINDMKICDYDFIFIFFDKVINEDTLWFVCELDKLGKPYCFVRSKLDDDIRNAKRENMDTDLVIPMIRKKIEQSIQKHSKLRNAKNIFFISCVDSSIGEMSKLIAYVESYMNEFKRVAALSSLAVFSEDIINLKYNVLKYRIRKVSIAAAAIGATPVPGLDIALNIALLVNEVVHYINCFGLSPKRMEALKSFDSSKLKCSQVFLPGAQLAVFVTSRLGIYVSVMAAESLLDLFLPFVGSLISGATSAVITYRFLSGVLDDLKHDSIIVYKHIVQNQ